MSVKVLLCLGDDASPQHWSVLRAIHPLNPHKIISAWLGGCCPWSEDNDTGCKTLCAALGGHFCRHGLLSVIVAMVVVDRQRQIIFIPT